MHNSNTYEEAATTSSLSCRPEKTEQNRPPKGRHRKRALAWKIGGRTGGAASSQRRLISNPRWLNDGLSELVFIYIVVTSAILITFTSASTNYWPTQWSTRRHMGGPVTLVAGSQRAGEPTQYAQERSPSAAASVAAPSLSSSSSSQQAIADDTATVDQKNRHQLMIGQHYNNFSSIVPYSIIQDQDYGPSQEDPLVEEQDASEILHQPHQFQPKSPLDSSLTGLLGTGIGAFRDIITVSPDRSMSEHHKKLQDSPAALNSRALLPAASAAAAGSNRLILPQMQQIKSRFNQGCVGGTKCQFFAFCWMSGGSLGASCGLLMTCCVTPSRQEIQPGFYGPVVNDPYCGRSASKINRIVGGTDASFGQFPWQAFVQVGGSRCGGALISSRHVVTAGHCVARSQHSPSSIKVTLGDYILNSDIESLPHEVFSVVEVLLHPNFRFTPQADRYDVAVLELDRTAVYKDNIKPICLPQKDATFVGRYAYVAGWGALQAGSKLRPKVLQHVSVPVIENQVCENWHRRKGIDIRIYDEMMCAGYESGHRDACQVSIRGEP